MYIQDHLFDFFHAVFCGPQTVSYVVFHPIQDCYIAKPKSYHAFSYRPGGLIRVAGRNADVATDIAGSRKRKTNPEAADNVADLPP